ncbi:unnamed protein product, partial [Adineta steineri]
MASIKRKYTTIAQSGIDYENPILNGKKVVKSKRKGILKIDHPSRWPGDVSNTFQHHINKTKPKTISHEGTSPTDTKLFSSDPMHKVGPSE